MVTYTYYGTVGQTTTTTENRYVNGIGRIMAFLGTTEVYYLYNAHGDVTGLTDSSCDLTKSYVYDAFGIEVNIVESDVNPFRYCGEYFDKETETYYLRARYYKPSTGRFTQQDPIGDGLNWYVYCNNNPVSFVDPSGQSVVEVNDGVKDYVYNISDGIDEFQIFDFSQIEIPTDKDLFALLNPGINEAYLELYDLLDEARNDLDWKTKLKSLYTTALSLTLIVKFDTGITDVSCQLGVPKAMIQAILFRELICYGVDDVVGDIAVKLGVRRDSSTGIGQIKAETAMSAYNPNNLGLKEMWNLLQDPAKNIEYVARVLLYEAQRQYIEDLYSITTEQRINIFRAYNAGEDYKIAGIQYGNAVFNYYNIFNQFNIRYYGKAI